MTKTAFIATLMAFAAAGQATAGGMPASVPHTSGANDPCLLGSAADKVACAGMIRVAPEMTVKSQTFNASSSQVSGSPGSGPTVLFDPNRGYNGAGAPEAQPPHMQAMVAPSAPRQQTVTVTSTYNSSASQAASGGQTVTTTNTAPANQIVSMNCVAPQAGASVSCRGYWVPAPQGQAYQAPPPPMVVQPQIQPQFQPQPAQVVILQPPSAQSPIMLPPPVSQTYVTQTMMPPVPCCQQQEVTLIPASFFMGGMSYGVGFPTETSYSYGGGGYAFVGGGTRFSGVRDRVHLDPPPRKPRTPPHKPCGCH
ncbi:MAG: hypothetical protein CFE32_02105 [Alphaproteobacteria bacterium PA3]|nr:MAG: hypothetical protein CFE32_02105 [Alphaproteobacteria bacterium PA3]